MNGLSPSLPVRIPRTFLLALALLIALGLLGACRAAPPPTNAEKVPAPVSIFDRIASLRSVVVVVGPPEDRTLWNLEQSRLLVEAACAVLRRDGFRALAHPEIRTSPVEVIRVVPSSERKRAVDIALRNGGDAVLYVSARSFRHWTISADSFGWESDADLLLREVTTGTDALVLQRTSDQPKRNDGIRIDSAGPDVRGRLREHAFECMLADVTLLLTIAEGRAGKSGE